MAVEVLFDPDVVVSALPASTSLTLAVPEGAQTGDIQVRVIHPLPDGGSISQLSGRKPFQVVWEFLDLEPIFSQYDFVSWSLNALSQGWENGPDIVFSINGKVGSWTRKRLWAIGQDSSESLLASFPTGYGNPRRNPITGHWFALIPGSGSGSTIDLVDMNTGETIFSTPNSWHYWTPRAFGFDSLGDLVIAADIVIPDAAWRLGLWRFEPGEQVVLDPSSPSALIPGVASNWGWQGEIAITDDDVIYCVDGDNDPNPAKIWRVPGFDGSPYQRIQMPFYASMSDYRDAIGKAYAKYNGKWHWSSSKEYANDILNNRVGRFPPLR